VDLRVHEFSESESDNFAVGDFRDQAFCRAIVDRRFDEVHQLEADMGGAGYIFTGEHDADVMHNSVTINLNMLDVCHNRNIKKIFYSSSACMYSAYNQDEPLNPDCSGFCLSGPRPIASTGGKPFSERLYLGYRRKFDLPTHMSRATIIFSGRGELGQAVVRRCQPQFVARLPWSAVATRSRCGAMANDTLVSISTSSWKVRYGCCALILRALLISGRRKW